MTTDPVPDDIRAIWVALPNYAYEGYGEPEAAFLSKESAETWRAGLPDWRRRDMEILEVELFRSPDTTP